MSSSKILVSFNLRPFISLCFVGLPTLRVSSANVSYHVGEGKIKIQVRVGITQYKD